jgi:hypothetical protein
MEKGGTVRTRKFVKRAGKPMSPKQKASFERKKKAGTLPVRKKPPLSSIVMAKVAARPHVGSALETEIRKGSLVGIWADTVK